METAIVRILTESRPLMVFPLQTSGPSPAGTLIVEDKSKNRAFVTTGRALLKFITPDSTFAASWTLKSPPSPMRDADTEDGDVSD